MRQHLASLITNEAKYLKLIRLDKFEYADSPPLVQICTIIKQMLK